jgi:hypothetical protein
MRLRLRTCGFANLFRIKNNDVAALSCAEHPRDDTDVFYRASSWPHARFWTLTATRIRSRPVAAFLGGAGRFSLRDTLLSLVASSVDRILEYVIKTAAVLDGPVLEDVTSCLYKISVLQCGSV